MTKAVFEFFERLADEFDGKDEFFCGIGQLQERDGGPTTLLLELRGELRLNDDLDVIPEAVKVIREHFAQKGQTPPFKYDRASGRFYDPNIEYLRFVRTCKELRSIGTQAQRFELAILERLSQRLEGEIHRVGAPRERLKSREQFNKHLAANFGFKSPVALGHDKDAGFDLLWKIPLGSHPFIPIVSIQCKNGNYNSDQAASSICASSTSLTQHCYLHREAHLNCVVFNDYLNQAAEFPKGVAYVPIGLSDLVNSQPAAHQAVRI